MGNGYFLDQDKDTRVAIWEEEQRFENPHIHYLDMSTALYEIKMKLLNEARELI